MNRMRLFSLAVSLAAATLVRADTAYYQWYSDYVYEPGQSTTKVGDGVMAYLINADKLGQQSILTEVVGNKQSLSDYLNETEGALLSSAEVNKGYVNNTEFSKPSEVSSLRTFFVLQNELKDGSLGLYFSGYSTITLDLSGTHTLYMNTASSANDVNWTTTYQGSATAGDSGGWYAVPEPTSGMMVMLGFALLGLRRREERVES